MRHLLLLWIPLFASIEPYVDEMATSFMQENKVQGLAIAVVYTTPVNRAQPLVRRTFSYGTLSRRSRIPVNQHTEFRIGPITETFTAALLASMIREGRADLSAPAKMYLPRSSHVPTFHEKQISLSDLATSTSGLPNVPYNLDSRAAISPSKLFRILSTYRLSGPPGKQYAPSNVGYALLSNILSRMGRASYADLLRNKIVKPLHMNDTQFSLTPEKKTRRATGYEDGYAVPPQMCERLFSVFLGSGGLFSTIDDMSMWLLFNLKIFTSSLGPIVPIMHKPLFEVDSSHSVALGWDVRKAVSGHLYTKGGSHFGFSSYMSFIPEKECGVVILSNNGDHSLEPIGNKLLSLIQQQ